MSNKFKYKIETLATDSVKRLETHVTIDHFGSSDSFYTGLYCNPETYRNFDRGSFSIDPVHYGFQKCFWFSRNWIEIVLYDFYIQSLLNPNTELLKNAQLTIIDEIEGLNKFHSFNYCYELFLLDKFRNHDDDPPIYADYEPYHRLLDCLMDYQLRSKSILTNKSENKIEFFKSVKNYTILRYRFKLTNELKEFLKWSIENNIALIDQLAPKWSWDF